MSTEVNRAMWDERAPAHAASTDYGFDRFAADPAHLSETVRFDVPRLGDVDGVRGVHLQCHLGTDTLSLSRLGAEMTGLDLSEKSVHYARRLAADAGADITYVQADVYDAVEVLGGYVRGTAIIAFVDAVVIGVALLVLGVPLALPLAVIVFVGAFVPLVGATVAGALAALIALVGNGPLTALIVVGVVIAVNQLEGDLLAPVVLGRSLNLHPLAVLLALTAGRAAFILCCLHGVPAARPEGLGALVAGTQPLWVAITWWTALAVAGFFVHPWQGPLSIALAATLTLALIHHTRKRFGGSNRLCCFANSLV